jgi:hypothetical protein
MKYEHEEHINRLAARLSTDRDAFVVKLKADVYQHISSQKAVKCLTVLEVDCNDNIAATWSPDPPGVNYIRALFFFCREETFHGQRLDSPLTIETVSIITKSFEDFFAIKSDTIANEIAVSLLQNAKFTEAVLNKIIESTNSTIPAAVRSQAIAIILSQMQDSMGFNLQHAIVNTVAPAAAKIVGASVSTLVVNILMLHLVKFIALHLHAIIVKVLASAAFKAMVVAVVKKIAVAAVIAGLAKLVIAKLGIGAGAAVALVVLPLIIAFIARELYILPDKLADEISEKVGDQISGKFESISKGVVEKIYEQITSLSVSAIAEQVAKQSGVKSSIEDLIANLL